MPKTQNILIIHLEFPRWQIAKSWSYETQLGLNIGLEVNGSNLLSFTKLCYTSNKTKKSWLKSVMIAIGNRTFDQIWVEVVHSEYSDEFLEFLCTLAPVRIAMMGESLFYTEEEYCYAPVLRSRYEDVKKRLGYFTHALCVDEKDVEYIEKNCGLRTLWWVLGIPEWSIANLISEPTYDKASFSGPVYGARDIFLKHKDLSRYMLHLHPIEKHTLYPLLFDCMQIFHLVSLTAFPSMLVRYNKQYINTLQNIRLLLYKYWIEGLQRGIAVVQLPHFVKAFPGRVYEGMAAGRPVITVALKNRPKAMQLFEPGKEILFYQNGPDELIELIKMLQKNKNYAKQIAENAAKKMKTFHTIDARVRQILKWIDTGDIPTYH